MLLGLRSQPVLTLVLPQANFAAEQCMHGGARTIMDASALRSTLLHLAGDAKEAEGGQSLAIRRAQGPGSWRCVRKSCSAAEACVWCSAAAAEGKGVHRGLIGSWQCPI